MVVEQLFRSLTDYTPYRFQIECVEYLSKGYSIILTAPTGSGKSEVALIPFLLKNSTLPPQMIYSLPTRTLINNLSERAKKYAERAQRRIVFYHGERPESPLFAEDIIVTTLDQTVGAYSCVPLSAPSTRGNIFAGSVSSAFLVFDEIHTYDPYRGLQTAITLIEHASRLKLSVCVMSATLPSVLVDKIKQKIIKPHYNKVWSKEIEDENEIENRKSRKVILHTFLDKTISTDEIIERYKSTPDGKLIVVTNTVDKAQILFESLKEKVDADVILIHSRFLEKDRKEKEIKIQQIFSKESKKRAILISTQVIEVGLDISSLTMMSEIAPIDSLIQRAGRCARWGGNGDLYVYGASDYGPYRELKDIIENTKKALEKNNGETLSWDLEKRLVNEILGRYYNKVIEDANRYKIVGTLARAAYEGNKQLAEEIVRDSYTCGISIHDNPNTLGEDIIKLEKVNVNVWVFRYKAKELLEEGVPIWKIEENYIIGDYDVKFIPVHVTTNSEIYPFQTYIVSPEGANYSREIGLVLGENGRNNFEKIEEKMLEETIRESYKKESWIDHAKNSLAVLERHFLPKYEYILAKFAEAFNVEKEYLLDKLRIAVALHDIGKLNINWQKKIGWHDGEEPLAHSNKEYLLNVGIPHATVSANALVEVLADRKDIGLPFHLAIAHHHSPRVEKFPAYKFISGWEEIVSKALPSGINIDKKRIQSRAKSCSTLEVKFHDISQEQQILPYRLYAFVSKLLRLSDWIATRGGIDEEVLYNQI